MIDQNRQAVKLAGLYSLVDSKLESFFQHFERTIYGCWPDLWPLVRESYPEYKEQLLTSIWDTGEKMLRLHMIMALSSNRNDELEIFQRLARRPSVGDKPWELEALMRVAHRRGLAIEM